MPYHTFTDFKTYSTPYSSIEYSPENADPEDAPYNWEDFVSIALGNITYAEELASRAKWTYPETMIDEDYRESEIRFDDKLGTIDIIDVYTGEPIQSLYDKSFFNLTADFLL